MHLPNAVRCIVDIRKVTDYLLNESHPTGSAKYRFFRSFGFSPSQIAEFVAALQAHAIKNEVTSSLFDGYGYRHVVECTIRTPDGRDPCIRTVWITTDDDFPRLVTAYPRQP